MLRQIEWGEQSGPITLEILKTILNVFKNRLSVKLKSFKKCLEYRFLVKITTIVSRTFL